MKGVNEIIEKGFVISGIINIGGVMIFSRFFTNTAIPEADPVVMSNFGLLMIVLWGLVFIATSKKYKHLKWLIGVFVIEKLIYGLNWTYWILNNDLSSIYSQDWMAGVFFSTYGLNDWFFFLFFLYVFIKLLKTGKT
tara:strand:+ start:1868 stop:2278 length:411 start_codon:yes stop_codon:yes gene_type:complete